MRDYVKAIARFFRDTPLAVQLLTDLEYHALCREATDLYYGEIHWYEIATYNAYREGSPF